MIDQIRFFAAAARHLEGKSAGEYMSNMTSWVRREPVGVCAQVAPWNYPLMMAVWKLGPALAAGNVQILKPAEQTPLTTLRFVELAQEFLPPGVLQVITGDGVPAGEVAFIHDARNDEARARLFARCRNGQIAVLIGSTGKMGVGTNIHTRAVALHHIDCPWRPADIEQREGRVIRQGNQNPTVEIVRYATEGSFDVYMWQTCERKSGFIEQVMRGQVDAREIDDIGDAALSYAEVKALATGDPRVLEQFGLQADLAKLDLPGCAASIDLWRRI